MNVFALLWIYIETNFYVRMNRKATFAPLRSALPHTHACSKKNRMDLHAPQYTVDHTSHDGFYSVFGRGRSGWSGWQRGEGHRTATDARIVFSYKNRNRRPTSPSESRSKKHLWGKAHRHLIHACMWGGRWTSKTTQQRTKRWKGHTRQMENLFRVLFLSENIIACNAVRINVHMVRIHCCWSS